MSEKKEKLEKLMNALKIQVSDKEAMEKDFDSILSMFDDLQKISIEGDSKMYKKQIKLEDLREDNPKDSEFRKDLKGKYLKVPSVSKKD